MKEEWKDVIGYEDYFKISNLGNLYSKRTNKILKQTISKTGYCLVSTRLGGRESKSICFKIHRLVAEAFLDPPKQYLLDEALKMKHGRVLVNHKDGFKTNNCVTNLEWCSSKENAHHAIRLGLSKPSPKLKDSRKITYEDAEYIRKVHLSRDKEFSQTALSKKFNIDRRSILKILNNTLYKTP